MCRMFTRRLCVTFHVCFQSALNVHKYHIALRLLQRAKDATIVTGYRNQDQQNLLHVLAQTLRKQDQQLQIKVHAGYTIN